MLEKSSRHVFFIRLKTKILTRNCFGLDFEWINSKWTVSRHLNDHSFKTWRILQLCLSPWTVTSDSYTSKNTTGTLLIYTTPKYGRFSILKLVQNFFHDQHLNHITVLWRWIFFPQMAAKFPEKYPSMDVKDPPLPPPENGVPILCPADTQHTVASISYRMVTRWPSPLVSN